MSTATQTNDHDVGVFLGVPCVEISIFLGPRYFVKGLFGVLLQHHRWQHGRTQAPRRRRLQRSTSEFRASPPSETGPRTKKRVHRLPKSGRFFGDRGSGVHQLLTNTDMEVEGNHPVFPVAMRLSTKPPCDEHVLSLVSAPVARAPRYHEECRRCSSCSSEERRFPRRKISVLPRCEVFQN